MALSGFFVNMRHNKWLIKGCFGIDNNNSNTIIVINTNNQLFRGLGDNNK